MLKSLKRAIDAFIMSEKNDPPYTYDFLYNLNPEEYPHYLKKIYKYAMHEDLDLKKPKNFNQKIQWLKIYDSTPLKTQLTDKVLVRDWIRERIGEEYLKPLLWVGSNFDEIPFDDLPEKFIIKANHGCKWHYKIFNKTEFLNNKRLFEIIRTIFIGWMYQSFYPVAGFELQYKNIVPRLLIEPLLIEEGEEKPLEYEIYCFNSVPKIFQEIKYTKPRQCCVFDCDYKQINLKFLPDYEEVQKEASDNLKLAVTLSDKLCSGFKLVRVDWLEHKGKIYFSEMTFTPFSGFYQFHTPEWNTRLGNMLTLK